MLLENLIDDEFEDFGHKLARAVLDHIKPGSSVGYIPTSRKYHGDGKADGIIQIGRFGGSINGKPGLVIFSYKGTLKLDSKIASKNLRKKILSEIEKQALRNPAELVLFLNRELPDYTDVLKSIEKKVNNRFAVHLYDLNGLESLASPYKHILWEYFDRNPFIGVTSCKNEKDILEKLKIPESDFPFTISEAPCYQVIKQIKHEKGYYRIVGQPGIGKSVLIAQLVSAYPDYTMIVVSPANMHNIWEHLKRMIYESSNRLILIFRNFHEICQRFQQDVLFDLIGSLQQSDNKIEYILIEYRSNERTVIKDVITEEKWNELDFHDEIILDEPPRKFIEDVFKCTCKKFNVQIRESMRNTCVDALIKWDNTPLAVVDWMRDYRSTIIGDGDGKAFYIAPLETIEKRWKNKFEDLKAKRDRLFDITLIQTFAILRLAGLPILNNPDYLSRCSLSKSLAPEQIDGCCKFLEQEGWLSFSYNMIEIQTHDIRISPFVTGLIKDNGIPENDLLFYCRRLIDSEEFPERYQILSVIGKFLIRGNKYDFAHDVFIETLKYSCDDIQLQILAAICKTYSDDEEKIAMGLESMKEIVLSSVDDPRPALEYARALGRLRKRDEAVKVVHDYILKKYDIVPAALKLAALATLFSLFDVYGATQLARDIITNHIIPESIKAKAACVLAQTGFVMEAEKYLEKLLYRGYKTLAVMAGLAMCFRYTKSKTATLKQIRETIKKYPQDPDIRLFFVKFVTDIDREDEQYLAIVKEAIEIIQLSKKIFKTNPSLLAEIFALEGVLFAESGNEEAALKSLRYALSLCDIEYLPIPAQLLIQRLDESTREMLKEKLGSDQPINVVANPQKMLIVANSLREKGKWNSSIAVSESQAYSYFGLFGNVENILKEGIKKDPKNEKIIEMLSDLLYEQERWEEVTDLLIKFRKESGNDKFAAIEAASCYYMKKYTDAFEPAKIAVENGNTSKAIRRILAIASYFGPKDFDITAEIFEQFKLNELGQGDLILLISSCDRIGNQERILKNAKRILNLEISNQELAKHLGFVLLKYGNDEDAKTIIFKIHKILPEEWQFSKFTSELALMLDSAGYQKAALRCCKAAVKELPYFQPIRSPLIHRLCNMALWEEALNIINESSGTIVSFGEYSTALAKICNNLGLTERFLSKPHSILDKIGFFAEYLTIGTAIELGRYNQAIEIYASISFEDHWLPKGGIPFFQIEGHEEDLIRAAKNWLDKNQNHQGRFQIKSFLITLESDFDAIELNLLEALEALGDHEGIIDELCELYGFIGKVDKMLIMANKMLEVNENNPIAFVKKAFALNGLGRPQEAFNICEEALKQFSDPIFQAKIKRERGISLREIAVQSEFDTESKNKLYKKAIEDLSFAWRCNESSTMSIIAYTASLIALERYKEARDIALEGCRKFKSNSEAIYSCAVVFENMNNHEDLLEIDNYELLLKCKGFASSWFTIAIGWTKRFKDVTKGENSFRGIFNLIDAQFMNDEGKLNKLRQQGLIHIGKFARELGLQKDAVQLLNTFINVYRHIPTFWFVFAFLNLDICEYAQTRIAIKEFWGNKNVEDIITELENINDEKNNNYDENLYRIWLPISVEYYIYCELFENKWEGCVILVDRYLKLYENNKEQSNGMNMVSVIFSNTPEGARITDYVANILLYLFLNYNQLTENSKHDVGIGLGNFDFQDAINNCEKNKLIASVLALIISKNELMFNPSIVVLTSHSDKIRQTLATEEAKNHTNMIVRKIAKSFCEENV